MLAAALGHHAAALFPGGLHWFRIGAWDFRTLVEMLTLRFGTKHLRRLFDGAPRLLVLDNHEDDKATARLLDLFAGTNATFVITARRCLLAGVLVFPVTAPLVTSLGSAFPRVRELTRMLRWNPLALDIADAIVASHAIPTEALGAYLDKHGIGKVHVIEHEDDLPEVALLVAWAWPRLSAGSKRMLAVLAHVEGDHVDLASLAELANAPVAAITSLETWHLVQSPLPGRFALHAVVRHAVAKRTTFDPARLFQHYIAMLEAHPDRLDLEQTHLFAAMDHAHRTSNLDGMLRVEALLSALTEAASRSSRARAPRA